MTTSVNSISAKCVPIVIGAMVLTSQGANQDITHLMHAKLLGNPQQTNFAVADILQSQKPIIGALETVNWLKNGGIPIAIIADIARVERKSVYGWLNGASIKEHNQDRLEKIHELLAVNKTSDLRNLYRFWHRQIIDDKSIGQLLTETSLDETAIKTALQTLWPLAEREQKLSAKNLTSNGSKTNPFLKETREAISNDT